MIKIIIYMFAVFLAMFVSGCGISRDIEAQKAKTKIIKVISDNSTTISVSENNINISKSDSKFPRVWVGLVSSDNGNINSSNSVWSGGDDTPSDIPESEGGIKVGTTYEVDIMNCGGYIGSGEIAFIKQGDFPPDWRLKVKPDTVASDGTKKIKQCDANTQDNYVNSGAFAINPRNENRQNIKIGKIDTRKVFSSLPKETQKSLQNKYGSSTHKKGELSASEEDDWTDIDGDGEIDLVFVFSMYDVEHGGGAIMMLINGKWKDVGSVRD